MGVENYFFYFFRVALPFFVLYMNTMKTGL